VKAVATFCLLVVVAGCGVGPDPSQESSREAEATPVSGAELVVDGRGTFDCGSGINVCSALLLIRPAGETRWQERAGDAAFPLESSFGEPSHRITGRPEGGPQRLAAASYAMAVLVVETSHLPSPPTPSGELHFYVLGRTTLRSIEVEVPDHARVVTVSVDLAPPCTLGAEIEPGDGASPMPAMR
jgi:hypothetical protein